MSMRVLLLWVAAVTAAAVGSSECVSGWLLARPDAVAAETGVWELQPLRITCLICTDAHPVWETVWREKLDEQFRWRSDAEFGQAWTLTVSFAKAEQRAVIERAFMQQNPSELESLVSDAGGTDKWVVVWLQGSAPTPRVLAWGFDLASRQWTAGPPHSAGTWQLMAPLAFEALEEVCAPLARVKSIDGERLVLRLRGGMIPARNPRRQSVVPGTVFRLVEVGGAGDSAAPQPRYATVARVDGHLLEVRVAGELPAGRFGAHDARWLAVGVPQLHGATRYAMQLQTSEPGRPLVGGEIWSGGRREAPETYEGVTDERGEVRITPRAGGVVWLQVRLGAVLLDAIPVVPGSGDAVTLPTHVSPARIRAAEALALSHDDMAELAAFRSLCVARIKAREAAGQTAEAEALRDECRRTLEERAANLHQRLQARKVAAASEASAEVAGAAAAWQALASDLDKLRASLTPSPPK